MRFIPPWQIDQSKFPKKVKPKQNRYVHISGQQFRIQIQGTERTHNQ